MKYLVVDMTRVMRESEHGRVALDSLARLVERTRSQEDVLRAKFEKSTGSTKKQVRVQFTEFQAKARKELDRRRGALQKALIGLAVTATRAVAEERGVELVLERSAVLVYAESSDVTDDVIAKVNEVKVGAKKASG